MRKPIVCCAGRIARRGFIPKWKRCKANLSHVKPSPAQWREVYLCVALTTMATLLLELSLTRIFSVVFYYHFAFLAISIALFGLGAGGVFSYVIADEKGNLFGKLGWLSALNSLLVVFALAVVVGQRH